MRRTTSLMIAICLMACGSAKSEDGNADPKPSAAGSASHREELCKQAGKYWGRCLKELMKDNSPVTAKDEQLPGCATDPKLFKVYETCLPEKTCTEYHDCIQKEALGR